MSYIVANPPAQGNGTKVQSGRPAQGGDVGCRGAYGLRVDGIAEAGELLGPANADWPAIEIRQRVEAARPAAFDHLGEERATLRLRSGGRIEVERDPCRATYVVPRALADPELAHPLLAPVAAVVGRWHGRESFHAGAFARDDGDAWAVLGDRESGKSSLLAQLAAEGHAVVCDDLLVVDEQSVFAGPRSIDLRADAAAHLGVGEAAGMLGARERWRVVLPPIEPTLRLRGWISLVWGDRLATRRLRPGETVALLGRQAGLRVPTGAPSLLLELAGRECVELTRPRTWASSAETMRTIASIAA